MLFRAKFQCAAGHEQEITYGEGFTRAMVEDHCVLMFGGTLHSLGTEMPGYGCAWQEEQKPRCGEKVSFYVEDIDG